MNWYKFFLSYGLSDLFSTDDINKGSSFNFASIKGTVLFVPLLSSIGFLERCLLIIK
jgi:hypothetical protein